jgi:predicted lipoprotein with Yx(FWY)xxD motif
MSTAGASTERTSRRGARRAAIAVSLLSIGVLAAACSSNSSSSTTTTTSPTTTSASNATVRVAVVPGVGSVLVDSAGRTVYQFSTDNQSSSTCTGACAAAWMPLVVSGQPTAGAGLTASLIGTVRDADGRTQVTYNRWPLYTFIGDTATGQAHGQGLSTFGGHWSALDKQGAAATTTAAGASTTSTTKASGGYGY